MQLVVNRSSMEKDDLQPPDDIGDNEDLVHSFASCADSLMMNPSWKHWLEELDRGRDYQVYLQQAAELPGVKVKVPPLGARGGQGGLIKSLIFCQNDLK